MASILALSVGKGKFPSRPNFLNPKFGVVMPALNFFPAGRHKFDRAACPTV
jgi:hypothetical protein